MGKQLGHIDETRRLEASVVLEVLIIGGDSGSLPLLSLIT